MDRGLRTRSPILTASLFASTYGLVCAGYIWVSGELVAARAASVEQLHRLEVLKGMAFIVVTTLLIFALVWLLRRSIDRRERAIVRHRAALIDSERRAVASVFAASVAHDINNVLTILGADVENLRRRGPDSEATDRIARTLGNLGVLSRRLMNAGRSGLTGEAADEDLVALVTSTAELARQHGAVRNSRLSVTGDDHVRLTMNATLVEQMVLNLILNAGEATNGLGRIQVRVLAGESGGVVEVHDDGPGIDPLAAGHLFEPFFTSKTRGNGLGLMAVRSCADVHGGSVEVARSPLGGALFRVVLRSFAGERTATGQDAAAVDPAEPSATPRDSRPAP